MSAESLQLSKYEEFINVTLKPRLQAVLEARNEVHHTMSEYQKLKAQIDLIQQNDLQELQTMVDLGSQFYVQAKIPDTTYIYVCVGFGFHVQFTLDEANAFIEKKNKHLQKMADKYSAEADKIRANIKIVYGAITELILLQSGNL